MGALSHEAKFQQDVKYKLFNLKNKKDIFKDVTRGGLGSPLSRSKVSAGRKFTKSLQRQAGMGGLVRTQHVCTYIHI